MLASRQPNAGQNQGIKIAADLSKSVTVKIFANDSNKSKFVSGGN
jgi:hypothetical protein